MTDFLLDAAGHPVSFAGQPPPLMLFACWHVVQSSLWGCHVTGLCSVIPLFCDCRLPPYMPDRSAMDELLHCPPEYQFQKYSAGLCGGLHRHTHSSYSLLVSDFDHRPCTVTSVPMCVNLFFLCCCAIIHPVKCCDICLWCGHPGKNESTIYSSSSFTLRCEYACLAQLIPGEVE